MFGRIFKHEFKNLLRDPMYIFLAIFPFIFALISIYLMPYLRNNAPIIAYQLVLIVFLLFNGLIFGAVSGFTLLDDQDDNVLLSLKITPISVRAYILFKVSFSYILGVLGTILLVFTSGFYQDASTATIIMVSILAPMQAPLLSMAINLIATNKVEGFVAMKSMGLVMIGPIASIFLTNWSELFIGILPGFWTTKLIFGQLPMTETYLSETWLYFLFGVIVHILFTYVVFKFYCKKQHI